MNRPGRPELYVSLIEFVKNLVEPVLVAKCVSKGLDNQALERFVGRSSAGDLPHHGPLGSVKNGRPEHLPTVRLVRLARGSQPLLCFD